MKLLELKQIIREEMDNLLSEGLKFHLKNKIRVNENIFRPGSTKYFELFVEVRKLSKSGLYKLDKNEKYWINETDIGEFALYEGQKVPLDFPMPLEEKKKKAKKLQQRLAAGLAAPRSGQGGAGHLSHHRPRPLALRTDRFALRS